MAENNRSLIEQYAADTFSARGAAKAKARRTGQRIIDSKYLNRERTWGEAAADTAVGLGQGVSNLAEAGYGLGNLATGGLLEQGTGLADDFGRAGQLLEGAKTDQLAFDKFNADQTFENEGVLAGIGEYVTNPALLGDLTATNLPSIIPAAGAGVLAARAAAAGAAARGLTKAATTKLVTKKAANAASLTGGAQMGGAAYTQAYRQAINEGLSPGEANTRALAAGASTAAAGVAISRIPGVGAAGVEGQAAARASGVAGAGSGIARDVLGGARREATEEYLQSGAETAILNTASVKRELFDNVAKSAALGALGGGLLGGGMGGIRAPSRLREGIESSIRDIGQTDEELAAASTSNLEQAGGAVVGREDAAAAAADEDSVNGAIGRADFAPRNQTPLTEADILSALEVDEEQALNDGGLVQASEDGAFWLFSADQTNATPLTRQEALDAIGYVPPDRDLLGQAANEAVAAQGRVEAERLAEEEEAAGGTQQDPTGQIPLPDAGGATTSAMASAEARAQAYDKVRAALTAQGAAEGAVGERVAFRFTNATPALEMDSLTAIEAARQGGFITDTEAALANSFVNPTPLGAGDPATADVEQEGRQLAIDQDETLAAAGYYRDDNGDYIVDGEFMPREKALTETGYVAPDRDLLGGKLPTQEGAAPLDTSTEVAETTVSGILSTDGAQPQLQGIDPLYDVLDDKRRKQAAVDKLLTITNAKPLVDQKALPISDDMQRRQNWMETLTEAINVRNGYSSDQFNFNASMKNSSLIRSFVADAASAGLEPNSEAAIDYIAEKAREAEPSTLKASQAIAIFADMVGATQQGTVPLSRWRAALGRKGISGPGSMKGTAYTKFKASVGKAAITPGSLEFDSFMQSFSQSLTKAEAESVFGRKVRGSFPYQTAAVSVQKKQAAIAGKNPATKPKAPVVLKAPKRSAQVAAATKTAEERSATEPAVVLPEPATPKRKRLNQRKTTVQANMSAAAVRAAAAEADMDQKTAAARQPRAEDLVDDGDVVDPTDPDVAAADAELTRAQREPLAQPAIDAVNSIVFEAQQRVARTANGLSNDINRLKREYAAPNQNGPENADVWQEAITAELATRIGRVDAALTKDITDITTWLGVAQSFIANPEFGKFADNNTKYTQFFEPMVAQFTSIVSANKSPDALRLHRTLFNESGMVAFAMGGELGGQFQKSAQLRLVEVNALIDSQLERKTGDPANPANNTPFKSKGKFSLLNADGTPTDQRMTVEAVQTLAEAFNRTADPVVKIEVMATVAETETAIGTAVPSLANGVYYNGRAIIIAENVTDPAMAQEVMLHESTHGGLLGLLGADRLQAVSNRLWANAQIRKRIQTKMKKDRSSRIVAAEEVLVDMIVHGEKLNKSVFSKIRSGLGRFAYTVFGLRDYVMPDAAVNDLLRDAGNYMRGATYELDMSARYVDNLDAYMHVVQGDSVPTGPKFSTATAAMDDVLSGGASPSDVVRMQNLHSEGIKQGIAQNLGEKSLNTTFTLGRKARRFALDYLPLSQIANLYEGLYFAEKVGPQGTDLLKAVSEDKLSKENEFNKTLKDPRDLKYEGPDGETTTTESLEEVGRSWKELTFSRDTTQADAINSIMHDGTFYKVHPDRDWSQQTVLDHTGGKQQYTEQERRQAHLAVREQWNKLTPESKQLYRRVQAAYRSVWEEQMRELGVLTKRVRDENADGQLPDPNSPETMVGTGEWYQKTRKSIGIAMGRVKEGPYSPLQRFGDYYVTIKNLKGEVVFNSGHATSAEAAAHAKHMGAQLPTDWTIRADKRAEFTRELSGFGAQQYSKVQNAVKGMFPTDNESDRYARTNAMQALEEVYLQSQPGNSLLKHANARKNIAGATTDAYRAFSDYSIKTARSLSSMRFDHRIQGALSEMRKLRTEGSSQALNEQRTEVADAVEKQHLASQRFQSNAVSEFATQSAFLMWMTSPSQLFLNASQTALVTLPRLAARYGIGDTAKFIAEATAQFARTKTRGMHSADTQLDTNGALYKVLDALNRDGTLDFTLAHDVSDVASRGSDLNHSRWREATKWMAMFIHKSEVYNREVAAYVVVQGEMRKANITHGQFGALAPERQEALLKGWTQEARHAVLETQFEYSQANKAAGTQGAVSRVVFQFQQFRMNMLAMMGKDIRDSFSAANPTLTVEERAAATKMARKTLAYMTGMQLLMTGVTGTVLAPVVFGIMGGMQDDDEILSPEEQMLQATPQWVSMGLMSGLLDPARFGFQSLIPVIGGARYMPTSDDPQGTLDHVLLNSLGPVYGLGSQMASGMRAITEGRFADAATDMLPKPFADAYAGIYKNADGIKDKNGVVWYTPTVYDRVVNTLGLKSGTQAEVSADRQAIYGGMQRISDRRSKLVGRWVMADGYEARRDALDDVAQWNRKNPAEVSIPGSTLQRALRTKAEKQRVATETNVASARIPQFLKDMTSD